MGAINVFFNIKMLVMNILRNIILILSVLYTQN